MEDVLGGMTDIADNLEEDGVDDGEDYGQCEDGSDCSSSIELNCVGCERTSKSQCPIAKKKGETKFVKLRWGKTSTRKRGTKNGAVTKKKIKCGEWCNNCINVARKWTTQKKYARLATKNKQILKHIKNEIKSDAATRERFKANVEESIHLKGGGRSRILHYKEQVVKDTATMVDLEDPSCKFYTVKKYRETFGDPKKTKAKIVTIHGIQGVIVKHGEDGVFDLKRRRRTSIGRQQVKHDGEDVLDAGELDEAVDAGVSELPDVCSGTLTAEETKKRVQKAEAEEAAAKAMAAGADAAAGTASQGDRARGSQASSSSSEDSDKDSDESSSESAPSKRRRVTGKTSEAASRASSKLPARAGNVKLATPKKTAGVSGAASEQGTPVRSPQALPASSPAAAPSVGGSSSGAGAEEPEAVSDLRSQVQDLLAKVTEGSFDDSKGRSLQRLAREWGDLVMRGKKQAAKTNKDEAVKILNETTALDRALQVLKAIRPRCPQHNLGRSDAA